MASSYSYVVFFFFPKGEWKPKQIDNPNYKGEWVHPEIDNPEYQPDDQLYKYDDIGALGFDLWQVRLILYWPVVYHLACKLEGDNSHWRMDKSSVRNFVIKLCGKDHGNVLSCALCGSHLRFCVKITKSCKPKNKTWEKESSKKTHFCPLTTTLHVVLTFQKCLQRLFLFPSLSKVEISCILVHTLPFVLCLTIYFFLLQVKSGTIFDNVLVTDSVEYAENFAKETFEKTKEGEKKMKDEQDEKERKEREEEEKKAKEEEDKKKAEEEDEEEEEGEVGLSTMYTAHHSSLF